MHPVLLANSLVMAALATVCALGLGVIVALGMQVATPRIRRLLFLCALGALALPAFFVAGIWMEWVGFAGAWRVGGGWLSDRVLPLICSSGVLALLLWPIAALLVGGAWDGLDPRLLEVTPELRGWRLGRHVLWPLARAAIVQPFLIILILALGNFSVPALFQARVWPAEVWVEFSTRYDTGAALRKSWLLAGIALVLAWLAFRGRLTWPGARACAATGLIQRRLGGAFCGLILAGAFAVVGVSLALPLVVAATDTRTWSELIPAARAAWPAGVRSTGYAAGTATLVIILGILSARRRWGLLWLISLVLPGIFVGILVASAGSTPVLAGWRGSAVIVLVALTLRYAFIGWIAAHHAWRSAPPRLREVARLAGAGRWVEWRHVVWPVAGRSLCGAWFVVYLLCLWDVETLILVVPPGGDSLALMIFNLLHYGHNAQVNALCLMLGGAAALPMAGAWIASMAGRWGRDSQTSMPSLAQGAAGSGWTQAMRAGALLSIALLVSGCSPATPANSVRLNSALFDRVDVIGSRGTGPGFFIKPRSVAVDAEGNLYVTDMTGRVQKFGPDGRWLLQWQMEETDIGRPKGMAVSPDGRVIVVEPHYHRVNLFSPDGVLVGSWGDHGTNAGQLWFPRSAGVTPDGDCYVSEYGVVERVQRFRVSDGKYVDGFGREGTGPGEFNRPEGLGVDAMGNVYVADSCNHRIQIFTATGEFVRAHGKAGQGPGEFSYPYDVRVDALGYQYVCEFGNSRVQIIDANDRPVETLGGPGSAPDQMHNPWSLCLDGDGNLYVADSQNHRVLKFHRRKPLSTAAVAQVRGR